MEGVVKSQTEWEKVVANSNKSSLLVIHFLAKWAPQCKQVTDVLNELKKDITLTNVQFTQVGSNCCMCVCVVDAYRYMDWMANAWKAKTS